MLLAVWAVVAVLGALYVLWSVPVGTREHAAECAAIRRVALIACLLWPVAVLAALAIGLWLTWAAVLGVLARSGPLDPFWSRERQR